MAIQNSKTCNTLEVLLTKRGVNPQLHLFLQVEFLKPWVFGNTGLEESYKNKSGECQTPIGPVRLEEFGKIWMNLDEIRGICEKKILF